MMTLCAAVFAASLAGSLHCAGMCGSLAAFAVSGNLASRRSAGMLQLLYHGGRLIGYAALGAACGAIGHMVDFGGAQVGVQRAAAILAGAMMVAIGLAALFSYFGVSLARLPAPEWLRRTASAGQRRAAALSPVPRAALIGLLTVLLPCGWLYAFAIVAAGAGGALAGAATMGAFWLGTLPVLALIAAGAQQVLRRGGPTIRLATSLAIVALGVMTVVHRGAIADRALAAGATPTSDADAVAQAALLNSATVECCRHGE